MKLVTMILMTLENYKLDFNLDELRLIKYALKHCSDIEVPLDLLNAFDAEIEKQDLDMSDWNDCGDACKL